MFQTGEKMDKMKKNMDHYSKNEFAVALLALFGFNYADLNQNVKKNIDTMDVEMIYKYVRPAHQNLVLSCYMENGNKAFADSIKEEYRKYCITSVAHHYMFIEQQYEIQKLLDKEGIRNAFIKGHCFDYSLFGDNAKKFKIARDIDILVHPSDALKAYQLLKQFSCKTDCGLSNYLPFYQRFGHHYPEFDYKGINIDIHHRIVWPYMTQLGINYFIPEILERGETIEINGKELRTVDSIDVCILLMCFIYKDQIYAHDYNPHNISSLLQRLMMANDYSEMIDRIKRYNLIEVAKYCVQLCTYLYKELFGKEFKCELDECSDFPVATDDYINQFRSHAIYCNDIIGYFDIPLENRYFMSTQELETYVYKESENKYKMSPQELFDQKVVKFVEHFGLKHPPTQRLV